MKTEEQELKDATQSTKRILDLIDPEIVKLEEELISDEDEMLTATASEIFYNKHFKKRLKLIVYRNLKRNAASETEGTTIFFKGALFGLQEIEDWFKKQISISLSRFDKKDEEDNDPSAPIESITND